MAIQLIPQLPDKSFEAGENMKLYPGALSKEIFDVLDKEEFKKVPIEQVWDTFPDVRNITFVRHLESKYNEYKELVRKTDDYKQFMRMENSDPKKMEVAMCLMKEYKNIIGTDYQTPLSEKGKLQGELF